MQDLPFAVICLEAPLGPPCPRLVSEHARAGQATAALADLELSFGKDHRFTVAERTEGGRYLDSTTGQEIVLAS